MLWKLFVAVTILIMGLKMVFTGLFGNKANRIMKKVRLQGKEHKEGCATFSKFTYKNFNFSIEKYITKNKCGHDTTSRIVST